MLTMTITNRFYGPPETGNRGYVCGMLARHIDDAAEAAMRAPVPLETALEVVEVQPGQWGRAPGLRPWRPASAQRCASSAPLPSRQQPPSSDRSLSSPNTWSRAALSAATSTN